LEIAVHRIPGGSDIAGEEGTVSSVNPITAVQAALSIRAMSLSCVMVNPTLFRRYGDAVLPVVASTTTVPVMGGCKEQKYL
jgi:hypothetical protein